MPTVSTKFSKPKQETLWSWWNRWYWKNVKTQWSLLLDSLKQFFNKIVFLNFYHGIIKCVSVHVGKLVLYFPVCHCQVTSISRLKCLTDAHNQMFDPLSVSSLHQLTSCALTSTTSWGCFIKHCSSSSSNPCSCSSPPTGSQGEVSKGSGLVDCCIWSIVLSQKMFCTFRCKYFYITDYTR